MAIENTYLLGKNITLGCGFDLQAKAPLDSRQTVPSTAGLQALIDGNAAYEGIIVYDEESKKTYQAQIVDDVLAFREFGINEAELKDLIASETTAAMEFKGAATALPENPAKGDMYKVTASFKVGEEDVKVGDSIVYDGEQWFIIPSGDDIEDTWRPVTGVDNDATLTFAAGDKLEKTVATDGTITYKHVAIDAPTNMNAEDDEHTRTYITKLITDNHGHIIGFKTATENVEDTNTTYEFEGLPVGEDEGAPSSVYFQVTPSEEGADTEVIYLDAYSKNEADATFKAKRAEKLDAVTTDANVFVDTVAQDVDGNITITTKAVDFSAITNRLDELEKVDHNHDNKELLDTYDQTNADIKDAVEKKHSHSFADSDVEDAISKKHSHTFTDEDVVDAISKEHTHSFSDEVALNGITAAKVADWDDAVSKEHTHNFVDTDVEDAISKKHAHTFVDTDVEDAISKKHSHTFVEAELNKIVDGDVAKWNTAAGKADDNAQAIEDIEGYVGTFTHDTAKTVVEYINAKTDGIATSGNLEALGQRVTALEGASATKDELNAVDAKFADYKTAEAQKAIDDEQDRRLGVIEGDYLKAADIADFETKENVKKVADDLAAEAKSRADADTAFETRIAALEGNFGDGEGTVKAQIEAAVTVEKQRAEGIEAGLRADIDTVKGDYLKASDKTELEGKITAEETRAKGVEEGLQTQINTIMNNPDAENAINSINEFAQYVKDHGTIADGMRTDINKNKDDIAAETKAREDADVVLQGNIDKKADQTAVDGLEDRIEVLEGKPFDTYATKTEVENVDKKFENYTTTSDLNGIIEGINGEIAKKQDQFANVTPIDNLGLNEVAATVASLDVNAYGSAYIKGAFGGVTLVAGESNNIKIEVTQEKALYNNKEIAVKDDVTALADNTYTKKQTFTKDEVNAAIAAAVEAAHTWGSF